MKAEELMIGDWIQNPLGWKARVMSIKHINVIRDEWEWLFKIGINNDTFQSNLSEDEVLPIPLTPEILEKNGFKKEGNQFVIEDDYYDVSIREITDSIWRVKYCNTEFSVFDCVLHIASVHELQHALRLCGIEKEVVI